MSGTIRAVIFNLDGVLVDSEQVRDAAHRQLTEDNGGRWSENATQEALLPELERHRRSRPKPLSSLLSTLLLTPPSFRLAIRPIVTSLSTISLP
jgi:beta-phosphoglucomutase-like phosphatase (HAD superfamily)